MCHLHWCLIYDTKPWEQLRCFCLTGSQYSDWLAHVVVCVCLGGGVFLGKLRCKYMLKFDSILFDGCKNLLFKSKVTAALTWTWLTFNKVDLMMSWSLNDLITMLSFSLQDQFDNLEKHTQWGIEYLEKYTKFVKERSEIEINYAKQIRWVVKMTCDPYCGLQGLLFGGGVFHPGSIKYAASTAGFDWLTCPWNLERGSLCTWVWLLTSLWGAN